MNTKPKKDHEYNRQLLKPDRSNPGEIRPMFLPERVLCADCKMALKAKKATRRNCSACQTRPHGPCPICGSDKFFIKHKSGLKKGTFCLCTEPQVAAGLITLSSYAWKKARQVKKPVCWFAT